MIESSQLYYCLWFMFKAEFLNQEYLSSERDIILLPGMIFGDVAFFLKKKTQNAFFKTFLEI